jgi:hypothetical protein
MDRTFILQVLGGIMSVGTVQLVIYLLKRKGELKALDRTSESSLLTGASDFAGQLTARIESQDKLVSRLEDKITKLEESHEKEREELVEELRTANREIKRLRGVIVRQETELRIAQGNNEELRRLLDSRT